jgi:hypothetical protein
MRASHDEHGFQSRSRATPVRQPPSQPLPYSLKHNPPLTSIGLLHVRERMGSFFNMTIRVMADDYRAVRTSIGGS